MNVTFTVGEFAKINNLNKQTLIYYDNIGLFKPGIVDNNNGYRYYTPDQLEILDNILILREIGVSIKEIKRFLQNRDIKKTIHLLQEQYEKLETQSKSINTFMKKLDNKISTLQMLEGITSDVTFVQMPEKYLAIKEVSKPNTLLETDIAMKDLFKEIDEKNIFYTYQMGVIISQDALTQKRYTSSKYVFLPLSKKEHKITTHKREKGLYAVIYHQGTYEDIGNSYEKLLNTISEYGFTALSDSYEYCISDSLTSPNNHEYITKILIRVK